MNTIDARGRSCPEPVIMTKNATESNPKNLEILVDTPVAVENITRFATNKGYTVESVKSGADYKVKLKK